MEKLLKTSSKCHVKPHNNFTATFVYYRELVEDDITRLYKLLPSCLLRFKISVAAGSDTGAVNQIAVAV